ncbi:MAG: hypothetical protein WBQ03_21155 [Candidatus Sulfotelmatobacter sp.]
MPNPENLKKQAKLILRWHRERHYPVAAQIRAHLPRFLNMPDSEILAASFKLSDAQEMVARQQGFGSWQALKTGLLTTSPKIKSLPSKATIVGAEPQLFVADIKKSCEFFGEKLGFSLVFSYGKPPFYAQVGRDAARLNLKCVERPVIESMVRDREGLVWSKSWGFLNPQNKTIMQDLCTFWDETISGVKIGVPHSRIFEHLDATIVEATPLYELCASVLQPASESTCPSLVPADFEFHSGF